MPSFAAGQRILASTLNALQPLFVQKQADQPAALSSTTLANDTELFLPVAANSLYTLSFWFTFTATAGTDIKIAFSYPAGATMSWAAGGTGTVNFTDNDQSVVAGTTARGGRGNGATSQAMPARGYIKTGATAGVLQVMFAQNASSGSAVTTMKAGSSATAQLFS